MLVFYEHPENKSINRNRRITKTTATYIHQSTYVCTRVVREIEGGIAILDIVSIARVSGRFICPALLNTHTQPHMD